MTTSRQVSPSRLWPEIGWLALIAVAYWVVVRIGLLFTVQAEGLAVVWPASGLALAVLLLSERRQWLLRLLVIFATNVVGDLTFDNPLPVSLGFALANTAEAAAAAWVLVHFCGPRITFTRVAEMVALCGVVVVSNGVTALLGAVVPMLAFGASFWNAWLVWWVEDGLGIMLITPVIVTWATGPKVWPTPPLPRLVEGMCLIGILLALTWSIFGPFTSAEYPLWRGYMVFPLLIWAALRFSPRLAATALLILAVIAVWNTSQSYGLFGFDAPSATERVLSVQVFLGVTSLSTLILAAVVIERKQMEAARREWEQLYRNIFDNIPDYIAITSLKDLHFLDSNRANCQMLGYSREELVHKGPLDFTPTENAGQQANQIQEQLKKDGRVIFETAHLSYDGQQMPAEVHAALIDYLGQPALLAVSRNLTERKQAEAALRASEERLRQITDNMVDMIAQFDTRAVYQYVSPSYEKILGYRPAELIGTRAPEMLHPDEKEQTIQAIDAMLRRGAGSTQFRFRHKDGSYRWIESTGRNLLDATGQAIGSIMGSRDITERQQAEESLRQRSAELALLAETGRELSRTLNLKTIYATLYHLIVKIMPCDAFFISSYNPTENLIRCEYAWDEQGECDVTGYPPIPLEPEGQGTQSLVIRSGEPLLLPDYEAQRRTAAALYYIDEADQVVEQIPDDADRPRSAVIVPLKLEGRVVGVMQVFSYRLNAHTADHLRLLEALSLYAVTVMSNALLYQQAQTELEERKWAEAALRESEQRFRSIVEHVNDAFYIHDFRGNILDCNENAGRMLGYSRQELVGSTLAKIDSPENAQYMPAHMAHLIEHGAVEFDGEHIKKDSSRVFVAVSGRLVSREGDGVVQSFVRDITARKQAEEHLKKTLAEKEALLRELYHRTKNNMQVICAMLELQAEGVTDAYILNAFKDMDNRIRAMALVHQMLYQAQNLSSIDLKEYIEDLTDLLRRSYEMYTPRISFALDLESVTVLIDTAIPCGLIVNELVSNALKHAFPADRPGEISIKLRQTADGTIILTIADNGIGLPPGFNPRQATTMGLQTLFILGERQLQGQVTLVSEGGVSCQVCFQDTLYEARV